MRKILLVAMLLVLSGCAVNVVTDSQLRFGSGVDEPMFAYPQVGPLPDVTGSAYVEGQDI